MVVEEAGTRYESLLLDDRRRQAQYGALLDADLDGDRVPAFAVDVPPEGGRKGYGEGVDAVTELVTGTASSASRSARRSRRSSGSRSRWRCASTSGRRARCGGPTESARAAAGSSPAANC
ncbi:hypothetical protein [Halorubrum sp. SD612]|uniref:hypothetical protein n=1 Tax=Halorubrum sp. SD612 TaxID=1855863 RepID=UPI000A2D070D|nr:hypothetical protein [Halorubrum sp. SD612]OTF07709.1 hypothetical protein B9G38_10100 [Halorubrum sp. SD612]